MRYDDILRMPWHVLTNAKVYYNFMTVLIVEKCTEASATSWIDTDPHNSSVLMPSAQVFNPKPTITPSRNSLLSLSPLDIYHNHAPKQQCEFIARHPAPRQTQSNAHKKPH